MHAVSVKTLWFGTLITVFLATATHLINEENIVYSVVSSLI